MVFPPPMYDVVTINDTSSDEDDQEQQTPRRTEDVANLKEGGLLTYTKDALPQALRDALAPHVDALRRKESDPTNQDPKWQGQDTYSHVYLRKGRFVAQIGHHPWIRLALVTTTYMAAVVAAAALMDPRLKEKGAARRWLQRMCTGGDPTPWLEEMAVALQAPPSARAARKAPPQPRRVAERPLAGSPAPRPREAPRLVRACPQRRSLHAWPMMTGAPRTACPPDSPHGDTRRPVPRWGPEPVLRHRLLSVSVHQRSGLRRAVRGPEASPLTRTSLRLLSVSWLTPSPAVRRWTSRATGHHTASVRSSMP